MDFVAKLGAVGLVLAALGAMLWWLRWRGAARFPALGRKRRRMEHLERLSLGPQHALHLVRLGEHLVLVAASPAGCTLVERFPDAEIGSREARP